MACNESTRPKPSLAERAYHEIKARIVYGTYRPGVHLSEATLARVHHSSRTPIREALSRLCEDRYVVSEPGRGFIISPVTISRIRNMFQVRRLLEGAAADGAAELALPEEIERMVELAVYDYRSGDAESYRCALTRNLEFHIAVANASQNELLADLVRLCMMQFDRVLSLGANFKSFHESSAAEHLAILAAIRGRDCQQAREAAEKHLDGASRRLMDAVVAGRIRGVAC